MHLLYADETSLEATRHEFFLYGGVAIPCDKALELHPAIETLRSECGIPEDFHIKFNPGPQHLNHSAFIGLKKRLMELAANAGCTLLTTISHHKILTSVEEARRGEINRIAFHFNSLLNRLDDCVLVLIDRFTDKQSDAHVREKFLIGLTGMPYSKKMRLERILGFHYSAIGQSHFSSLIDALIGSMRFVIDAFSSGEESRLIGRDEEALVPLPFRRWLPMRNSGTRKSSAKVAACGHFHERSCRSALTSIVRFSKIRSMVSGVSPL